MCLSWVGGQGFTDKDVAIVGGGGRKGIGRQALGVGGRYGVALGVGRVRGHLRKGDDLAFLVHDRT